MRTATRRAAAAGAVLLAAGAATALFRAPETNGAEALERVRVTRADVGAVVKATGVIKPVVGAEVRVGSRASGIVRRLHVRVGDVVASGQLLAELDVRELESRRDERRAALASAAANASWARADLARKRRLAAEGLLPAADLELAERGGAVSETQEAEARAALASVETQLGWAEIRAPIAGTVASVATQEGETVAASLAAPTFVTLVDLARLELRAYVDETDIGRVHPGQEARFTVDTYPGRELEGRVETIYPQAEIRENVVDYVAVVRFEPPADALLRPEMTATVRIAVDTRKDVLTLPRRAVRRDGGRTVVLFPGPAGSVVTRAVTTGAGDEERWEIRAGAREGDEVLVGEIETKKGETR